VGVAEGSSYRGGASLRMLSSVVAPEEGGGRGEVAVPESHPRRRYYGGSCGLFVSAQENA